MSKKNDYSKLTNASTAMIIVIVLCAIFFSVMIYSSYQHQKAEAYCSSVQNHPDLSVPCVCRVGDGSYIPDHLKDKTKPLCVCTCDVNGSVLIYPIFRAI